LPEATQQILKEVVFNEQPGYVLAIVFGIIIFIVPSIVAYLIALFLVIWGILGVVQSLQRK